jgi:hypothetical protein
MDDRTACQALFPTDEAIACVKRIGMLVFALCDHLVGREVSRGRRINSVAGKTNLFE